MRTMPRAVITGVAGALPDYILTNEELSRMVDTSDEWIMTRIGIKERRILKEPGKGTSELAKQAVQKLFEKTNTSPEEIEFCYVLLSPDHLTANIITQSRYRYSFDMNAGCSSFHMGA